MLSIDYGSVPVSYMAAGVQRYIEHGIEPGSFLRALFSNDLRGAVARADGMNITRIPHWVVWMENNLPGAAWGSASNYEAWIMRCGIAGRMPQIG